MIKVQERDYVSGDAYISCRDGEPRICNFCGEVTTTHIRIPSLTSYAWWCEKCQKIPETGWDYLSPMVDFSDSSEGATQYKSFLDCYSRNGLNYKWTRYFLLDQLRDYLRDVRYKGYDKSISKISDTPIYENDLVSSIVDFNTLIEMMLKIMSGDERKLLAIKVEENNIGKYLSDEISSNLFKDFDSKELSKYNYRAKAKLLNVNPEDKCLRTFHKLESSLSKKLSKVISKNGFDDNFKWLGKKKKKARKNGTKNELRCLIE